MKPILFTVLLSPFLSLIGWCAQPTADSAIWSRLLEQASTAAANSSYQNPGCLPHAASTGYFPLVCTNGGTKLLPLPALDPGVAEIKFGEFFQKPIGPRGLQLTEKLKALDGRRVRLLGYMVQEERAIAGRLLLAPFPVQLHSHDNALADDLPPSTVHVVVPQAASAPLSFTPKLLLLTGTLSLGSRPEADGRTSLVRLILDPVKNQPSLTQATAQVKLQNP
ncbi:MAG: hypothetical protein JNN07_27845 [Verrucomicrobiales bacterium]|nr:hypothetical protein [Verrucomicrobiales bacterium]